MTVLKWLLGLVLALAVLGVAVWFTAPRDIWPAASQVEAPEPADDLDAWLAAREAVFDDITPDTEKQIVWAREAGSRTDLALVYLHGYSATRQEISPVAETLAQRLGANLFATRLAGHGRSGAALAAAGLTDWATDIAEAMAIARRLGERIILIGTSTGGSLAVLAAADPAYAEDIDALVMLSPNFEINNPQAWLLDLPYARHYLPAIMGDTREWEPHNAAHGRFWTTRYPTEALFAMRAVQTAARDADHSGIMIPALIFYAADDQVVEAAATARVIQNWGGRIDSHLIEGADDPSQHVIAGDILSPSMTGFTVDATLEWLRDIGLALP